MMLYTVWNQANVRLHILGGVETAICPTTAQCRDAFNPFGSGQGGE